MVKMDFWLTPILLVRGHRETSTLMMMSSGLWEKDQVILHVKCELPLVFTEETP